MPLLGRIIINFNKNELAIARRVANRNFLHTLRIPRTTWLAVINFLVIGLFSVFIKTLIFGSNCTWLIVQQRKTKIQSVRCKQ